MATPRITVKVEGLQKLQQRMARLRGVARDEVKRCVRSSAIAIQNDARRTAPVDTGRLRASVAASFENQGLSAEIGSRLPYALYVERGTRPHFPPVQALGPWARRVLRDERLAFIVARGISRRGTPPRPFLEPAYDREVKNFLRCARRTVRQAAGKARR